MDSMGQDTYEHEQPGPESTREALIEAATGAFAGSGYAGASVAEIAGQARVTKSLVHHHFGSKLGLWDACLARCVADVESMLEALPAGREPLVGSGPCSFPLAARVLGWAKMGDSPEALCGLGESLRRALGRIEHLQALGELRSDVTPVAILHALVFAHVMGSTIRVVGVDSDEDSREALERAHEVVSRGITPGRAR